MLFCGTLNLTISETFLRTKHTYYLYPRVHTLLLCHWYESWKFLWDHCLYESTYRLIELQSKSILDLQEEDSVVRSQEYSWTIRSLGGLSQSQFHQLRAKTFGEILSPILLDKFRDSGTVSPTTFTNLAWKISMIGIFENQKFQWCQKNPQYWKHQQRA